MAYENYTIQQYMDAKYKGDRSVMSEEEFQIVQTEYIDTAGLYESEEFSKVCYITFVSGRINSVNTAIRLHREFINHIGQPYLPGFEFMKLKGHKLYWNKNYPDRIEDFLKQLEKVEQRERKWTSILENEIKNLTEMRLKKKNGVKDDETGEKEKRGGFIKTINSLRKIGYPIVLKENTMEEFSYMVKQAREDAKEK